MQDLNKDKYQLLHRIRMSKNIFTIQSFIQDYLLKLQCSMHSFFIQTTNNSPFFSKTCVFLLMKSQKHIMFLWTNKKIPSSVQNWKRSFKCQSHTGMLSFLIINDVIAEKHFTYFGPLWEKSTGTCGFHHKRPVMQSFSSLLTWTSWWRKQSSCQLFEMKLGSRDITLFSFISGSHSWIQAWFNTMDEQIWIFVEAVPEFLTKDICILW